MEVVFLLGTFIFLNPSIGHLNRGLIVFSLGSWFVQAAICLEHNKGKIDDLIVLAWKARERTIGSVFGIKVLEDYDLDDSGDA